MHPAHKPIAVAAFLGCALLAAAHAAPQPAARPAAGAPSAQSKASGRLLTYDTCTRVIEGDLIEGAKVGQIRLVGVIAPAQGEAGWRESLDYTRRLTIGKQIKVEICDQRPNDYRDRVRAVVYLPDGSSLNTKLLRAGMARLLEHKPCHVDVSAWQRYEDGARKARLGLWAGSSGSDRTARPDREERSDRQAASGRRSGRARVRIRPQP